MTKTEIINIWAKNKVVEDIVKKYSIKHPEDLVQMIYLDLLKKDDELIQNLHTNNQYNFYIAKMITTNVKSMESPYYREQERFTSPSYTVPFNEAISKTDNIIIQDEDFELAWSNLSNLEQRVLKMYSEKNLEDIILTLQQEYDPNIKKSTAHRYIEYCYNKLKSLVNNTPVQPFKRNSKWTEEMKAKQKEKKGRKLKPIWCKHINTGKVERFNNIYDAEKYLKVQKQIIWNCCKNGYSYKNKFYFSYNDDFKKYVKS